MRNKINDETKKLLKWICVVGLSIFAIIIVIDVLINQPQKQNPIKLIPSDSETIVDDVLDDDYLDYNENENEYDVSNDNESKIESKKFYKKVNTKKLYNNYSDYDEEYVKTTIRVNKINKENYIYKYRVYDTDEYDEVLINFYCHKKLKIKKGDYLTVSGYCTIDDDEDPLIISIDVEKINKVNRKLFRKFGGTEKKTPQEYKNALAKAEDYADQHMSKQKLYHQLISEYGEGFPADAAKYAIDNLKVDYKKNALFTAKDYYYDMHMSKEKVYQQLVSKYGEEFTPEEARYAVNHLE